MSSDEETSDYSDFELSDNDDVESTSGEESENEAEGVDEVEGSEEEGDGETLAKTDVLQKTILTTTAALPSLAAFGLSLPNFTPTPVTNLPVSVPSQIQIPASLTLPPMNFQQPAALLSQPVLQSVVPSQTTFQGLQSILTPSPMGTALPSSMYFGAQIAPGLGTGAPTITPKQPSPKKLSTRTIYYTAVDLTPLRNEDLKLLAKEVGLKGYSTKKKDELVAMLLSNPITTPKTIKVVKSNIEEDLTILPVQGAQGAVAPLPAQTAGLVQTTVTTPMLIPQSVPLQFPVYSQPPLVQAPQAPSVQAPQAPSMTIGGLSALPTFNMGSIGPIGPIQTGPAAVVNPPVPVSLKDLTVKQAGETTEKNMIRAEVSEKANEQLQNPQLAANAGAVITNQALLGVTYNKNVNNVLDSVKL